MPGPVAVLGTMMECDMGDAPDFLIVEPLGVFANDLPVATIFDIVRQTHVTVPQESRRTYQVFCVELMDAAMSVVARSAERDAHV